MRSSGLYANPPEAVEIVMRSALEGSRGTPGRVLRALARPRKQPSRAVDVYFDAALVGEKVVLPVAVFNAPPTPRTAG